MKTLIEHPGITRVQRTGYHDPRLDPEEEEFDQDAYEAYCDRCYEEYRDRMFEEDCE